MAKSDQAQRRAAKERFAVASRMEKEYARQLRYLTRHIDHLVKGMADQPDELVAMLTAYSTTIDPWARSVANKMLLRIASKDEQAWISMGRAIGKELRKELDNAPTGQALSQFLDEQVTLIKSLPLEAGQRVHRLTQEGLTTGRRAEAIRKDILETGHVTASRAQLIARTEVARTASGLTMARAQHVGATHYYWRTSSDGDVRESHKKMNGKIIAWNAPPEVDPGKFYHAGMFPNCRCWPSPILEGLL
jgi:SPP1 gp7 family putative phage head morphogenesis protein